jgi:hypothetical protein
VTAAATAKAMPRRKVLLAPRVRFGNLYCLPRLDLTFITVAGLEIP